MRWRGRRAPALAGLPRLAGLLAGLMVLLLAGVAAGCGGSGNGGNGGSGGGGGSSADNVQPISVNLGVTNDYADGVFTSVTVCAPGSSTECQTIPDVLVDTGSYGLRLLDDQGQVTVPLAPVNASSGGPLGECAQYAASYNWGPVVSADVVLGGETAPSVPVQLIGASGFPAAPDACTNSGLAPNNTQQDLGANGILGIGVFRHDCGAACAPGATSTPAAYFSCPNSGCTATLVALDDQVQNPVWLLPQDNNGVVVTLPNVPAQGALSVTGTITFGINTQSDNQLGNATVLLADGYGDVQTTYQGQAYDNTVFDSGSNGNFFLDSSLVSNLPDCTQFAGFYCPSSTQSFSATLSGASARNATATTTPANWMVANAEDLFNNNPTFGAFNNLAGPYGTSPTGFDFGLPFFLGKSIYVGINGTNATSGSDEYAGPFYAY